MDRQAKQAPLSDLLTDISEDSDRYGVPISLPYVLVFYVIISHQCQKNKWNLCRDISVIENLLGRNVYYGVPCCGVVYCVQCTMYSVLCVVYCV